MENEREVWGRAGVFVVAGDPGSRGTRASAYASEEMIKSAREMWTFCGGDAL
jgi:hypothetical protein